MYKRYPLNGGGSSGPQILTFEAELVAASGSPTTLTGLLPTDTVVSIVLEGTGIDPGTQWIAGYAPLTTPNEMTMYYPGLTEGSGFTVRVTVLREE
jgi:hypothetical protein